ncbi:MAG: Rrf2 family transcriptional regulator [Arenimonas sp.]
MLSRKAKYALRALSTLALAEPAQLQARRIAQEAKVPEKFLEAILVELRNAGIVSSRRGTIGGHSLAKPAEEIMVGDIIRIIDGPIAPLRCASISAYQPCADCIDPPTCALRELMGDVRDAMSAIIDKRSLRELAQASLTPPAARAG